MPFDLTIWKEKTARQLGGWKKRFDKAGVDSAYYFLAAVSFVPVVQAVHNGDWGALAVLGTTLGGAVGTNLLANMVQKLKDKSDVEIAEELVTETQVNPDLKAELDALLEKLETLPQAEGALADDDKAWFVETIQKELAHLNSGVKYEAKLIGDGSIAQGNGATAIGKGGVQVKGKMRGNIITGDQNRVVDAKTYIEHQTVHEAPDLATAKESHINEARHNYLTSLYRRCQSLPLVALGDDPNAREDVTLDDVYISLNTTAKIDAGQEKKFGKKKEKEQPWERVPGEDERPLTAFEAFLKTDRLVLLGDPGSGKSTFVRNLLAMQAQVLLGKRDLPLDGVPASLLPVLVTLRDLIPALSELDCKKDSAERRDAFLVKVIDDQITSDLEQLYRTPEFTEGLRASFTDGSLLLAFDGLDEVPEHLREKVRLAVAAYQKAYDLPRIILTCRIRSYRGAAEQPGFDSFTLAPFTQEQVQTFCQAWYRSQVRLGKLDASASEERAQDLASAAWRDELQRLSENPMLLTTMAIIHQKETRLPNERVKLYSLAVRVLIERWQKHRFGEQLAVSGELAVILKDEKRVRKILERLAYEAHRIGKKNDTKKEADLLRKDALEILEGDVYLGEMSLASELLDYIDQRSGLLVGRGGEPGKPSAYSFAHRTFQEYLAGCYLTNQRNAARQLLELASEPEYWSLAIEFGSEELYYNGRTESQNDVLDLAYALLAGKCKTTHHRRSALWSVKMAALVGTDAIRADVSPQGGEAYLEKILSTTIKLLEGDLTAVERADAGRALARLGDPRLAVTDMDALEFCLVPGGQFWMGSKKKEGDSDEQPQHKLELHSFWMGRYPVTNAQYQIFVDDGGYKIGDLWEEARKAKVWKNGQIKGRWDDDWRTVPMDFGEPFRLSNHPVVGITWYEMLAFTRWLDARWRAQGYLDDDWQVVLPSEAEWEKAARGGVHFPAEPVIQVARSCHWDLHLAPGDLIQNPTPQRDYPWGGEFDLNFANVSKTGIGATSAVGCFLSGASPYGVQDLSGNVWEWTRSLWEKYPYPEKAKERKKREDLVAGTNSARVLRGGSFDNASNYARCAYRSNNLPYYGGYYSGFRVVVSPLLPSS